MLARRKPRTPGQRLGFHLCEATPLPPPAYSEMMGTVGTPVPNRSRFPPNSSVTLHRKTEVPPPTEQLFLYAPPPSPASPSLGMEYCSANRLDSPGRCLQIGR